MIVFLIFFVFLVTVMIITVVVANSVLRKRDVDQMKTLVSGRAAPAGVKGETPLMKDKAVNKRDAMAQLVLGSNLTEKLRSHIEQAGLDWDPARTVYLSLLLALLGFNLFWYAWDWDGAERAFQRTLQLNPSHATALSTYGHILSCLGRVDEGIRLTRRAVEI